MESLDKKLAINGGTPARKRSDPPMYPGGNLIDEEEERSVLETLRSKRLFRYYGPNEGPSKVEEFEQAFREFMGARYALAVTSGTAALVCGLQAVGIGPGDEVIIPAFTWIATASAVLAVGGVPVLAEVDRSLTLDPQDVEAKINAHTRAIIPVHMRGVPCKMDEILTIARSHQLKVVEDAAQADGASYHGRRLGSLGDVGCYSLQFNKIITSGEGGMVVTNQENIWQRAIMYHDVVGGLRNHLPDEQILWGINFRMPELLAAVMLVQLRRLDGLLEAMRARKRMLVNGLDDIARRKGVQFQEIPDPDGDASVAFIFFAEDSPSADRIAEAIEAENIGTWRLYKPDDIDYHVYRHWTPIIHQRTWTPGGGPWRWAKRPIQYSPDECPRSLDWLGRAVHLDVYPLLTNLDMEETIEGITKVLEALA